MEPLRAGDPERIGGFLVQGRLGAGGMGQVYLGESAQGTRAAIKVIRDELAGDTGFRSRFRREVAAAAAVGGMFTARVLDADPDADPPWLATEYVDGRSLRDHVDALGPLPEHQLRTLELELAEALSAIHAAGLVHRDLKPANVMLSPRGARVIDFGIAHSPGATQLTGTGEMIGTPEFMAPEQVTAAGPIGPAVDVFSMGSTLAFAATGHSPFTADQAAVTLYRILNLDPDLRGIPPRTLALVEVCLARDPAARPTAAGIASQIRAGGSGWAPESASESASATMADLGAAATYTAPAQRPTPAPHQPTRRLAWWLVAALIAVVAGTGAAVAVANNWRTTGGIAAPATTTPVLPDPGPGSKEALYLDRLCASGAILTTLGSTAPPIQVSSDLAVVRREFLDANSRTINTVDIALGDYTYLRDEAPTPEIKVQFGLIVDEFERARVAFTQAQETVEASDPLAVEDYATGVSQVGDGARSLAFAASLLDGLTLPATYTAARPSAPRCQN